jgi:hypothetical protein
MHQIAEYSAVVGAGWLSSNVLFVIAWSWMHSPNRRWMSETSARPSIFKLHPDDTYLSAVRPHHLSGSVTLLGPVNRAS